MQTRHKVVWEIDIYAETPQEAAQAAWEMMQRSDSIATYFEVYDQDGVKHCVDLNEEANAAFAEKNGETY